MSTPAIAPAVAARHMPAERLFHPVELGRYNLPHRMVMAPLTRSRVPASRAMFPLLSTPATTRNELRPLSSLARQPKYLNRDRATPGPPVSTAQSRSRAGEGSPTRCIRPAV
jgi:hypothetical protein